MSNGSSTPTFDLDGLLSQKGIDKDSFDALPLLEKHKAFQEIIPGYKGLPVHEQQKALQELVYPNPPEAATSTDTNAATGFATRAIDTAKGMYHGLTDPPQPGTVEPFLPPGALQVYRAGKGMVQGSAEALQQSSEQLARGAKALPTEPAAGAAELARGAVTGLSAFNPFAAGPVMNINRLKEQGKGQEAIGQGTFDVLSLALGTRFGKMPGTRGQTANLTAMAGGGAKEFEQVLPDLNRTVQRTGIPTTPNAAFDTIEATSKAIDQQFNQALFPVRNNSIVPTQISQRILDLETPNMSKTAAGRAQLAEIKAAATEYQQPWTLNELNAQRSAMNSELTSYYKRGSQAQAGALSDTQVAIRKAVRDGAADLVYDEVDRANPGANVRALKQRQSALWKLKDRLNDRIDDLHDKQLIEEGKTLRQKIAPNAYVSAGGVRGHLSGLTNLLPGGGAETQAATQVRRAFRSSPTGNLTRGVLLSTPITQLMNPDQDTKGLPAPPEP